MAGIKCSNICGTLGFKTLKLHPDGEKLEQRFKIQTEEIKVEENKTEQKLGKNTEKNKKNYKKKTKKDMAKMQHKIIEKYLMGQNVVKSNIPDLVNTLLKRDCPKIYHWDGKKLLGPTFVPPGFVPKYPKIIDHKDTKNLKERLDQMKILEEIPQPEVEKMIKEQKRGAVGDMAERAAFDVLQDFFKKMPGTFLVIQGLKMINIDPEKRKDKSERELDFVVIDGTYGKIINIEVKNHLTEVVKASENESSTDVAKRQVEENREFLEDWLGADISDKWQFLSMIFTLELDGSGVRSCDECNLFIACGKKELFDRLQRIYDQITEKDCPEISPEEFKIIAKYLLFCSPVVALPIGGNFNKAVLKAIAEAGSLKNIKIWCFLTPDQRMILYQSHIIFLSCWGTGKTLLMISKAIEIADGKEENVLFLIFIDGERVTSEQVPLLVYDLELKFKDYPRIHVKPVHFIDGQDNGLVKLTKRYSHIMVDELFDNSGNLSERSQTEIKSMVCSKTTVWIATSNSYTGIGPKISERPDEDIKNMFPLFEVAEMKTPLRSPRKVVQQLKEQFIAEERGVSSNTRTATTNKSLNHKLLMDAKMPPNITDGHPVLKISPDYFKSLGDNLKKCFVNIPQDKFALIIICDDLLMVLMQVLGGMINCKCTMVFFALAVMHALKSIGRPTAKIHTVNSPSNKPESKKWVSGEKSEDMIVGELLANGFEFEFVITIGVPDYWSRSSALTFSIETNILVSLLPMVNLLIHDHNCGRFSSEFVITDPKSPMDIIGM